MAVTVVAAAIIAGMAREQGVDHDLLSLRPWPGWRRDNAAIHFTQCGFHQARAKWRGTTVAKMDTPTLKEVPKTTLQRNEYDADHKR
jgi:hypothetical protein